MIAQRVRKLSELIGFTAAATLGVLAISSAATAQDFVVLHAFSDEDGTSRPQASLIEATDGNFYGTTAGASLFRMTLDGTVAAINAPGASAAALIQATDGNLYGTTYTGGAFNQGTVFSMTLDGTVTVLHGFDGTDGASPHSAVLQGSDGNLYGTTNLGGLSGRGTVFRMALDGTFTVLHDFMGGADGALPNGALIEASDGNFYGTTISGGSDFPEHGTVFTVSPDSTVTILHAFTGFPGAANPTAALLQTSDGRLYGTTALGGAFNQGTVFTIAPDGTVSVLHDFTGFAGDGNNPNGLIQGSDGLFYGTTFSSVFQMTADGAVIVLHSFTASPDQGAQCQAALIQASDGNFYGTTSAGGASNEGVVFRLAILPAQP